MMTKKGYSIKLLKVSMKTQRVFQIAKGSQLKGNWNKDIRG